MFARPDAALRQAPRHVRDVVRQIAGWALFWALAAGVLYLAAPGLDSYGRLLVFSECTGMAIVACVMVLRPLRRSPTIRPAIGWMVTGIIAVPTGYLVGHGVASLILGEPFHVTSDGNDRMVPIVFTVLIGGFGLHYFATREQLANEATARSEAQRRAAEAQLRMLRAQLEPHMLFNTLANLRSLVKDDADKAEAMVDQLITYLRGALAASRTEWTTLGNEFAQLRAYLEIMALRMGPRLAYRLELPQDLEQVAVPPMLLQPLVENAVKHGLEPKVGAGSVAVVARRTDAGLEIAVTDTGRGMSHDGLALDPAEPASGSYGLLHVRERLHAAYGLRAALALTPMRPTGVSACVSIRE